MKTIAIIGAGAAGLMTTATILENTISCHADEGSICFNHTDAIEQIPHASEGQKRKDFQIYIFEKNKTPGSKVIISGGGRCNVTTSITDKKILATKYTRGWDFIRKAMGKFSPAKTYEWFEAHGVPLKTQADMRVFPVSDDGYDVVEVFEKTFAKYRDKITLHYGEAVSNVSILSSGGTMCDQREPYPRTRASDEVGATYERGEDLPPSDTNTDSSFVGMTNEETTGFLPPQEGQKQNDSKYTITTSKGVYQADILVITTGGNAYSHTGSTGDGYAFARALGHTVTTLGPSLSSFLTNETWTHALSGLAFENARISYNSPHEKGELEGVTLNKDSSHVTHPNLPLSRKGWNLGGPLLLTHFGLSGPLAFMFSSEIAWEKLDKNTPKTIHLSPLADMNMDMWDEFLKKEFLLHPKKTIITILPEKLARRFVDGFVGEFFSHISETYVSSVSKTDRLRIAELLGNGLPITLIERRPGDEFVTAGGVSTDELDAETMESKIQKDLYFAGEVLNVDGYTGGFSLQICWSSGYAAGRDIASKL